VRCIMKKITTSFAIGVMSLVFTPVLSQNIGLQLVSQQMSTQSGGSQQNVQEEMKRAIEEEIALVTEVNKAKPELGFTAPQPYDSNKNYTQEEVSKSRQVIALMKHMIDTITINKKWNTVDVVLFKSSDPTKDEEKRTIPHWKKNEMVSVFDAKGLKKLPPDMDTRQYTNDQLKQMMITGRFERQVGKFVQGITPEKIEVVRQHIQQIDPNTVQQLKELMKDLDLKIKETK
jgi:hypothetical protein